MILLDKWRQNKAHDISQQDLARKELRDLYYEINGVFKETNITLAHPSSDNLQIDDQRYFDQKTKLEVLGNLYKMHYDLPSDFKDFIKKLDDIRNGFNAFMLTPNQQFYYQDIQTNYLIPHRDLLRNMSQQMMERILIDLKQLCKFPPLKKHKN